MSEKSVVKSRASVMLYNNDNKTWEPAEGIRGTSYVQVYHHEGNNSYRIVGRSMTDQQVVVINCSIVRNLKYNAATPTFHQWRDQRQVYGLNFHSKDDATQFKEAIDSALEELNTAASQPKTTTHTQQYVPQSWKKSYTPQINDQGAGEDNSKTYENTTNQEHRRPSTEPVEKPKTVSSSVNITPVAPTPPPAPVPVPQPPAAPAAPPAPPAPPAAPPAPAAPAPPPAPPVGGGGGVPAPPPPPPPPSVGGGAGGGGGTLASQIAAAKLKKAEAKPEPKPSGGSTGPFGGDMMAEMQRKLAARKAKDGSEDAAPPPKNQVDARNDRLPSVNKMPVPKTNHVPPPPAVNASQSKTSTLRQERTSNSEPSSGQLQELKSEILAEFRKELDIAKADIIQAIRQELSRGR